MGDELTNAGLTTLETEYELKLDAAGKALLADKQILAWLLKECAEEYTDCSILEIMSCIESEPVVGVAPIDKDLIKATKIKGMPTEDTSLHEGLVKYDILFQTRLPDGNGTAELIVNVEAQNDFRPGYSLVTRGIYYASRLISSQKNTRFDGSDYQNISKVYSVWVCINPAASWQDTITLYRVKEENLVGNVHETPDAYDKLCVVLVGLGNEKRSVESPLINMLKVLLDVELLAKRKMQTLQDYGIQSTKTLEGRASAMCNFSKGVLEKGIEQGIEQGIERGIKAGRAEERKNSMATLISTLIELGSPESLIIAKVADKFGLSKEEAKKVYTEYQNSESMS